MKPHNPQPLARDDLAQARADAQEFSRWLDQLRSHGRRFAQASVLYPDDHTEWQSAVYLITGNHEIWTSLGPTRPRRRLDRTDRARARAPTPRLVLRRVNAHGLEAHLWNISDRQVVYPYHFDRHHFSRWITACHIRERLTPTMTEPLGGPQ